MGGGGVSQINLEEQSIQFQEGIFGVLKRFQRRIKVPR
jgi:hypothetical protein